MKRIRGHFIACDNCHLKKLRCEENRPCFRCIRSGVECKIERTQTITKPSRKEALKLNLESRMESSESAVTSTSSVTTLRKESTSNYNTPLDQSTDCMPLILDRQAFMRVPMLMTKPEDMTEFEDPSAGAESPEDKSVELRMDLVDMFYLHIYPSFPVLPKELFLKYADKFPHFCIASINAFASVYMSKGDDSPTASELGEKNSIIARRLLDSHINTPTPIIIYGLLLLGSYFTARDQFHTAWTFIGMAIRMAYDLRLNEETNESIPELEGLDICYHKEIKVRLFWMLYGADVFISSSCNLPCWVAEQQIFVRMPMSESIWTDSLQDINWTRLKEDWDSEVAVLSLPGFYSGGLTIKGPLTAWILLLAMYKRISKHLIQVSENQLGENALLTSFYALESSLEAYVTSLPPWAKPSCSTSFGNVSLSSQSPCHWIYVRLAFGFHFLRLLLYKSELLRLPNDDPNAHFQTAFAETYKSAHFFSSMVDRILVDNPDFHYTGMYVCVMLYEAGRAWILMADLHTNPPLEQEARMNLAKILTSLSRIGRICPVATIMHDGLYPLQCRLAS